jgi:hypothetical protein
MSDLFAGQDLLASENRLCHGYAFPVSEEV